VVAAEDEGEEAGVDDGPQARDDGGVPFVGRLCRSEDDVAGVDEAHAAEDLARRPFAELDVDVGAGAGPIRPKGRDVADATGSEAGAAAAGRGLVERDAQHRDLAVDARRRLVVRGLQERRDPRVRHLAVAHAVLLRTLVRLRRRERRSPATTGSCP